MDVARKFNIFDLKQGDKKTFEAIFFSYAGSLERFAYEYVSNREEATDIVQSVFLTLWERKTFLHDDSNLTNYLITLTKNRCLNYLRDSKSRLSYETHETVYGRELLLNYYALERFNENTLITEELSGMIKDAIDSLPIQCREMFMMNRFEGLTYQQIAEKYQVSVKTVEKKMSQSLQIMRHALKDYILLLAIIL
jgi:RNA polymerase sigma-70 factor, ECF subfamily